MLIVTLLLVVFVCFVPLLVNMALQFSIPLLVLVFVMLAVSLLHVDVGVHVRVCCVVYFVCIVAVVDVVNGVGYVGVYRVDCCCIGCGFGYNGCTAGV